MNSNAMSTFIGLLFCDGRHLRVLIYRGAAPSMGIVRRTVDNSRYTVGIVYTKREFLSPNVPRRSVVTVCWRSERRRNAFAVEWLQPGRAIRLAVGPGIGAAYRACLGFGERSLEVVVHALGPALGVL